MAQTAHQSDVEAVDALAQSYDKLRKEIGKVIGLSKERVRQIKEKGLANLRSMNATKELASTS